MVVVGKGGLERGESLCAKRKPWRPENKASGCQSLCVRTPAPTARYIPAGREAPMNRTHKDTKGWKKYKGLKRMLENYPFEGARRVAQGLHLGLRAVNAEYLM
jgi:hypothetical protein